MRQAKMRSNIDPGGNEPGHSYSPYTPVELIAILSDKVRVMTRSVKLPYLSASVCSKSRSRRSASGRWENSIRRVRCEPDHSRNPWIAIGLLTTEPPSLVSGLMGRAVKDVWPWITPDARARQSDQPNEIVSLTLISTQYVVYRRDLSVMYRWRWPGGIAKI